MIRLVLAALLALLPLAARAQTEQQTLVDRATLAVQEMLGDEGSMRCQRDCSQGPRGDDLPARVQGRLLLRRPRRRLRHDRPAADRLDRSRVLRHGQPAASACRSASRIPRSCSSC